MEKLNFNDYDLIDTAGNLPTSLSSDDSYNPFSDPQIVTYNVTGKFRKPEDMVPVPFIELLNKLKAMPEDVSEHFSRVSNQLSGKSPDEILNIIKQKLNNIHQLMSEKFNISNTLKPKMTNITQYMNLVDNKLHINSKKMYRMEIHNIINIFNSLVVEHERIRNTSDMKHLYALHFLAWALLGSEVNSIKDGMTVRYWRKTEYIQNFISIFNQYKDNSAAIKELKEKKLFPWEEIARDPDTGLVRSDEAIIYRPFVIKGLEFIKDTSPSIRGKHSKNIVGSGMIKGLVDDLDSELRINKDPVITANINTLKSEIKQKESKIFSDTRRDKDTIRRNTLLSDLYKELTKKTSTGDYGAFIQREHPNVESVSPSPNDAEDVIPPAMSESYIRNLIRKNFIK